MKSKLLVAALLGLSIFLRVYNVGTYPPMLWDEAALGYNAYSLLKTGKDEHNKIFPLIYKSFGDFKPGLYIYTALPFVATLGLNEFSTRLPSILSGILICFLLYKFTKSKSVLFLAAITPYLIHYSRGAWETNLASLLLLVSLYFHHSKKYFWAVLFLGLNLYAYQSGKFFSALFFLFFFANLPKQYIKHSILLLIMALPILIGLINGKDSNRLQVISLLSYPRTQTENQTIKQDVGNLGYGIFYSQPLFFFKNYTSRYLNHFSPEFLFTQGDWQNPRHSAPYTGVLLLASIFLLPIGLLKSSKNPLTFSMLFWLLVAPIAASLTRDQIQATRSAGMAIPLAYFSGIGLQYLFQKRKVIGYFSVLLCTFSLVYYLDLYYNHMIQKSPKDWLYGYKQAVNKVESKNYDHIYFTDFYGQPYIYYLFYSKFPPLSYQVKNYYIYTGLDTGKVENLHNITFTSPSFNSLSTKKNTLLVFSHDEILRQGLNPANFEPLGKVGDIATFYAYETK